MNNEDAQGERVTELMSDIINLRKKCKKEEENKK